MREKGQIDNYSPFYMPHNLQLNFKFIQSHHQKNLNVINLRVHRFFFKLCPVTSNVSIFSQNTSQSFHHCHFDRLSFFCSKSSLIVSCGYSFEFECLLLITCISWSFILLIFCCCLVLLLC